MIVIDKKNKTEHEVPDNRALSIVRLNPERYEIKQADIKPLEQSKEESEVLPQEDEEKPRRRGRRPKKES